MVPTIPKTKDVTVRLFEVRFKDAGPTVQTVLWDGDTIDFNNTQILIESAKNGRIEIERDHVAMWWMRPPQTTKEFDTFVPQSVVSEVPSGVM
jgi:hypothetical protein